ncbi:MAG: DUF4065 domain-containing protein [Defluviitaleaceae bacterium]|nr:DUF4065 domain-containing protein [Defluviitaleaceae bacterium]
MTSKYSVRELATHIYCLFDEPLEQLKLEKLCYYAQAWYCSLYNESLIDEDFIAAKTGPKLPSLRNGSLFDGSGALQISGEMVSLKSNSPDKDTLMIKEPKVRNLVESVHKMYGGYSGAVLSEITHTEPPWQKAVSFATITRKDVAISREDMQNFYNWRHNFYAMICQREEVYKLRKLTVDEKALVLDDLNPNDNKHYTEVLHGLTPSVSSAEIGKIYPAKDINGSLFEYFKAENSILVIITPRVKEYAVKIMSDLSDLKNRVRIGSVSFHWQTYKSKVEGNRYMYASPELGIMVCQKTVDDAINDALENLEHQFHVYSTMPCAPQDTKEKELVCLAYSVYKSSLTEFLPLLGLNISSQQQGEVLECELVVM